MADPVITLSEAQDANIRLDPLRRLLSDVDKAVKYATSVTQGFSEKQAALDELSTKVARLTEQAAKTEADFNGRRDAVANQLAADEANAEKRRLELAQLILAQRDTLKQVEADVAEQRAAQAKLQAQNAQLQTDINEATESLSGINAEIVRKRQALAAL
jgi:septal ring factor EnvC (AmiA/AmiB activator)